MLVILDRLDQADRYTSLHLDFAPAIAFLRTQRLDRLPLQRIEISGQSLYAMVSKNPARKRSEARLEAHRKHIDIQYLIDGMEEMGWKSRARCQKREAEYDAEKDVELFADAPDTYITVHPGAFVIFFPDDAHAPLIGSGEPHKIVIKVAL
jgi:YhcH/YjgK/YiaL family protein